MEKKFNNVNLLDCTLRDGGYYNNWDFDEEEYKNYLKFIQKAKIKYIELGFRFFSKNYFLGPFAYSKDNFIKFLKISKSTKLAVMLNCSELIKQNTNAKKTIEKIFSKKNKSKVSIVRLAAHFEEVPKITNYLKILKKFGYKIFINLMQSSTKSENDFKKVIDIIKKSNAVDVLYFADSLGSMGPKDINEKCQIVKKYWKKDFGIHTHDNCKMALKNSICAIQNGAKWIDATIAGMGRGAGNVTTEDLIKNVSIFKKKYSLPDILKIKKNTFIKLKEKYSWGSSKTYKYAAKNNIHPSYVQVLENEKKEQKSDIINFLKKFKKTDLSSYNPINIKDFLNSDKIVNGTWNAKNRFKNQNVLILGKGRSVLRYKKDLEKLKKIQSLIVFSLNINKNFNQKLIDYYLVSNQEKIIVDYNSYSKKGKKVIIPKQRFKKIFPNSKYKKHFLDYGLSISKNKITIKSNFCKIPSELVLFYALSLCIVGKVKNIYLAGFDGYSADDPRQVEINKNFELFQKKFKNLNLSSITPTSYNVPKSSIYSIL